MATAIVSGRVDAAIKERAGAYIRAAGSSVGDVINIVWNNIAATGRLPAQAAQGRTEEDPFDAFISFCDSLQPLPDAPDLSRMDSDELRDLIGSHLKERDIRPMSSAPQLQR